MQLQERRIATILSLLPLAAVAACHGKGSETSNDPGQGGAGDGSGNGGPPAVSLSVDDPEVDEGDSGTTPLTFHVRLSSPYASLFTIAFKTVDGTAKSDAGHQDYQPVEGVLLFEPGTTSQTVQVLVNGDDEIEPHETFSVELYAPSGPDVALGDALGTGRIRNDDNHELTVQDAVCHEGDFGESVLDFVVRMEPASEFVSTVYFATQDSSAANGTTSGDYLWRRGLLVFQPGETEHSVLIRVFGDLEPEPTEEVGLVLFTPHGPNVVILDGEATGTILDDDQGAQLDEPAQDVDAYDPDVARSGDLICSVFRETGPGGYELHVNRSVDQGLTWSTQGLRIDHAPAGADLSEPRIAVDGQHVYVVWRDGRNGATDLFLQQSNDGGLTWAAQDRRLDTDPAGTADSLHPRIAAAGGNVYVLWEDHRNAAGEVRFTGSQDAGASWLANDVRLNNGPTGAACLSPEMAVDGDRIYVVWSDARNGQPDVYFDSSFDGGSSWRATDLRIDRDLPGAAASRSPQVACSGDFVYVAWEDQRNGASDVYFNSSLTGGDFWESLDKRLDDDAPGAHASRHPRISCDGLKVAVAWDDDRSGPEDVFCSSSASGGFSWWGNSRVSRNGAPGSSRSVFPQIAHHGSTLVVVWQDDRKGGPDLYMNMSTNSGQNFLEEALRIEVDATGGGVSQSQRLLATGEDFQFVWRRSRASEDALFRSISIH